MSHTAGHPEVDKTIMRNKQLIEAVDDEVRRLREERGQSARLLERAQRGLQRLSRRSRLRRFRDGRT